MSRRRGAAAPVVPCVACGTEGGGCTFHGRPARFRGEHFGITGYLCSECRRELVREEADKSCEQKSDAAKARALAIRLNRTGRLVVLTPPFQLDDLNHAAASAYIRTRLRPPEWALAVANRPAPVP